MTVGSGSGAFTSTITSGGSRRRLQTSDHRHQTLSFRTFIHPFWSEVWGLRSSPSPRSRPVHYAWGMPTSTGNYCAECRSCKGLRWPPLKGAHWGLEHLPPPLLQVALLEQTQKQVQAGSQAQQRGPTPVSRLQVQPP